MKSSLQTLTRIQKFNIDEQRKILAEHLSEENKLEKQLISLNEQFVQEKAFAQTNPSLGDFGAYTKRYILHREELEQNLLEVRQKIETVRDIMADMFKEQKTYEIVEESRKQRRNKESDAKEQKTLDEIGTNTYIKRKTQ